MCSWLMPIICMLPFLRRFRPIIGEQVAAKMVLVSQKEGASREFYRLNEIFIK
ncbi:MULTISPECIES: hypothetical protein [unclassified Colwellia]|uniref:hypothetical protein n=1 Tax=unclassified Colwellia TaxID=196834 RepID=UPI0028707366|nr:MULTISPECIES: hypothetical protein [unclassified Colwellia]